MAFHVFSRKQVLYFMNYNNLHCKCNIKFLYFSLNLPEINVFHLRLIYKISLGIGLNGKDWMYIYLIFLNKISGSNLYDANRRKQIPHNIRIY